MTQPGETKVNTGTLIAVVALVVALLGAAVALALAGWDGTAITGLLVGLAGVAVPVVALLDRFVNLQRVNVEQSQTLERQDEQLTTINRRVNGELDERIRAGAQAAAVAAAEEVLRRVLNGPTAAYPLVPGQRTEPATDSTRTGE